MSSKSEIDCLNISDGVWTNLVFFHEAENHLALSSSFSFTGTFERIFIHLGNLVETCTSNIDNIYVISHTVSAISKLPEVALPYSFLVASSFNNDICISINIECLSVSHAVKIKNNSITIFMWRYLPTQALKFNIPFTFKVEL